MTATRTYPDRTCEKCRSRYAPTSSNQKACAECMAFPRTGRPFIPYDISLGDGEYVRLILPEDLTQAEADRICGVIQALPFAAAEET